MRSGTDEGVADQFQRLNDDLVLVIFNKLWDAKLISRCSTVCKRFASLTPLVHNVFLSIPPMKIQSADYLRLISQRNPPQPVLDILLERLDISAPLSHFREIHHLRLEFPPNPAATENDYSILGCFKTGSELQCFAILSLTCLRTRNPNDEEESEEEIENHLGIDYVHRIALSKACFKRTLLLHLLLKALIKKCPMLASLAFDEDKNKLGVGHYCLTGESLVEMKERVNSSTDLLLYQLCLMKMMYCDLPLLRLPVSGHVMEGVWLMLVEMGYGEPGCAAAGSCSDAAFADCFEEEEDGVFREAVAEILTNHKNRIISTVDD